jgi:hypothetical protein
MSDCRFGTIEHTGKVIICEACGEESAEHERGGVNLCLDCLDNTDAGTENEEWPNDPDDPVIDGVGFADPGGDSALRASSPHNPRNLPCPTCGAPNRLTPADREQGYHCDACANRAEQGQFFPEGY